MKDLKFKDLRIKKFPYFADEVEYIPRKLFGFTLWSTPKVVNVKYPGYELTVFFKKGDVVRGHRLSAVDFDNGGDEFLDHMKDRIFKDVYSEEYPLNPSDEDAVSAVKEISKHNKLVDKIAVKYKDSWEVIEE